MPETNLYTDPTELLLKCLTNLSSEEITRMFAPDGKGFFEQEVVDASRVTSTEDLLDSFSFADNEANIPNVVTEEWWIIFQWHPVKKQLLTGDQLRERIARQ